jgi:hypothetical protein
MTYTFKFLARGKNLPKLRVDMTNVHDSRVRSVVTTVTDGGGPDLFYDPIPAGEPSYPAVIFKACGPSPEWG